MKHPQFLLVRWNALLRRVVLILTHPKVAGCSLPAVCIVAAAHKSLQHLLVFTHTRRKARAHIHTNRERARAIDKTKHGRHRISLLSAFVYKISWMRGDAVERSTPHIRSRPPARAASYLHNSPAPMLRRLYAISCLFSYCQRQRRLREVIKLCTLYNIAMSRIRQTRFSTSEKTLCKLKLC